MRFVKLDKEFLGKPETRASLNSDLPWVCAYLEIEPDGNADGHGGEAVLHESKVVGSIASVAFGHTYGKILAFAYVRPHVNVPGTEVEVVIHGKARAGRILGDAVYDPQSNRPRTDA